MLSPAAQQSAMFPMKNLFNWCCGARLEALGRIHFAGASIVAMAVSDGPYTQAEADRNAAAANVGRPAAIDHETLRDRTRLWEVG